MKKTILPILVFIILIIIVIPVVLFADPPVSFDLRDVDGVNYVSSVKIQSGGTCWAHGAYASIEGNLLITGNWSAAGDTGEPNLAEYHVDWWNGFNQFFNEDMDPPEDNDGLVVHEGGDFQITSAYLTRGEGTVRDIDGQSFSDPPERTDPNYRYYYVRDIEWYTVGEDLSNINHIKNKLMTNGVIGTCLNIMSPGFMDDNFVQYQPPDNWQGYDHIVAIVGWDDNKTSAAPLPGAWLCKNSWGSSWGLDGYFWISYYDRHCCQSSADGAVSLYNVVLMPYDHVFYHDYHGWRETKTNSSEAFNVFIPPHNERLLAVNFATTQDSVNYTVRIYDRFTGVELQDELFAKSGFIACRGFHTVDLDTPLELIEGDDFYIYLQLSEGGHAYDASGRLNITTGGRCRAWAQSASNPGESYYLYNSTWHDLYNYNPTANFCIKGLSFETYMKVIQTDNLESEGPSGGPYTPPTKTYQFTHKYDQSVNYSITPDAAGDWISLSGDIIGNLQPYDTAEVIVEINSNADTLCDGVHYAAIYFANMDDPLDDTVRYVRLVVGTPSVRCEWMLDNNPGWVTEGEWQFGQPTGEGGNFGFGADPSSGCTGDNVYGYNLYGNYPNNLPETHLTTTAINCSRLVKTHLKFQRWLCVDGFGRGFVSVSNDQVNWTKIWEGADWLPDSTWNEMDLDISSIADSQATVYLRWTMVVDDALYTFGGWNIDDIQISAIYNSAAGDILCGDINGDEDINIFDVTYLISYLYMGGLPPVSMDSVDVNNDGTINIFDVTYLISYLYMSGPPPDCP